jgi:hypothetical protein
MALALAVGVSRGEVIRVPDDHPTIQLAINHASDGDTVLVAPDIYHEAIRFLGRAIVVGSWYLTTGNPAYADSTIIEGGGTLGPLVSFTSGEDSLSALTGFTLRDGRASEGGGILCRESSPVITECIVRENEALYDGGGLMAREADPLIEDCRFESNESTSRSGGGIAVRHGSPRILASVVVGNVAHEEGGGIFCEDSAPVIFESVIDSNLALVSYGGGIMSRNSTPVVVGNLISRNHSNTFGGGMFY